MIMSRDYGQRRVWILGAGFSRPLGAPLLNEIFTEASFSLSQAAFPGSEFPAYGTCKPRNVLTAYELGGGDAGRRPPQGQLRGLWFNPEQFIERLTMFHEETKVWPDVLTRQTGIDTSRLLESAKRQFAAEVSEFLMPKPDLASERWEAHKRWVRGLDPDRDAIITFNYDLVIEHLLSEDVAGKDAEFVISAERGKVPLTMPVLKMHGSVDWREIDGKLHRDDRQLSALTCKEDELAIGVPGAHKTAFSKRHPWLWEIAKQLIANAASLHFVGYRLPETDGLALKTICDALRNGFDRYPRLNVNVVLGPNPSPDRNRLDAIVRRLNPFGASPSLQDSVCVHNMWTQDYFNTFDFELGA